MIETPSSFLLALAVTFLGAAFIALYTLVNVVARRVGARAHWWWGLGFAVVGMSGLLGGWIAVCSQGPRLSHPILRYAGWGLVASGFALYVASARKVGRWRAPARHDLALSATGLYSRVRHPQALALALGGPGLAMAFGSIPGLLVAPFWVGFWVAYTFLEERVELIPSYGEAYLRYRDSTPRILPRLSLRARAARPGDAPPER